MGAISSLRTSGSYTMRVLILSVLLACATAAPSGEVPVAPVAVLPAAIPTIDPGDIQAAAINAQVFAEDQARAAIDSARSLNEKVVEESNEKVVETGSLIKEKNEEAFWAGEEKKWQALDAVNTAEAKLDGAVANSADAIAKSAFGGVVIPTYVASPIIPGALPAPLPAALTPLAPITYTPGIVAKKEEEQKELVKTAEPEKKAEKTEQKTEEHKLAALPLLAPISTPAIKLGPQFVAPFPVGPVAPNPVGPVTPIGPYAAVAYLPQPILTPVIKAQW